MTTVLSSKGQVVLPQAARRRLGLRPGVTFDCRLRGNDIVLTPRETMLGKPRFVRDKLTGMVVTESPKGLPVLTGEHVRSLLSDFP